MRIARDAKAVLLTALLLFAMSLPCMGATYWVGLRTAGGSDYYLPYYYCPCLDTSEDTCYGDTPWCLKTRYNNVKLEHWHFTTNFTETQRADANRYREFHSAEPDPSNRYLSATTSFNCHAYALSSRDNVWNVDRDVTLTNDFHHPPCGPLQVGDVIKHNSDHTSVIVALNPTRVMSKWGAYGKYRTSNNIYGGVHSYWRPKP